MVKLSICLVKHSRELSDLESETNEQTTLLADVDTLGLQFGRADKNQI